MAPLVLDSREQDTCTSRLNYYSQLSAFSFVDFRLCYTQIFWQSFLCPLLGKVGYFENKYLKLLKIIILSAT